MRSFQRQLSEVFTISSIYFIFSLIAFRTFLLRPGTVGHNWDWHIPPTAHHLVDMSMNSLFTWAQQSLGFSYGYGNNILIFNYILGYAGHFGFTGAFVSKSLLIIIVVISGCSMYYLIKDMQKPEESPNLLRNTGYISVIFGIFC